MAKSVENLLQSMCIKTNALVMFMLTKDLAEFCLRRDVCVRRAPRWEKQH